MSLMLKIKPVPASLQLLSDLDAGGVTKETVEITRALVKAGATTIVASKGGRLLPDMLRTSARHIMMNTNGGNAMARLSKALKISRIVKKNNIRIIHARGTSQIILAALAGRLRPVKLIATPQNLDVKNTRLQKALAKFDHVVAVSHFMADQIREMGVDDSKISFVPRGIDLNKFNPDKVNTNRIVDLSRKWRMPDGLSVILVPSRLNPTGGQAFLIETLATMKDLPFICILPGDETLNQKQRAHIEKLIIKLGLDQHVRFAGYCDDMPAAYKLADIVVSPALKPEHFSHIAVEAQAMGRLLVTADHGGGREAIIPDLTALAFEPGNAASLENTLRKALKMSLDDRKALGHAARSHVMKHYRLENMCAGTLELYAQTVDETPKS